MKKKEKRKAEKVNTADLKLHLTKEGSLGILAYGDIAVQAWRKIKKAN